MDNNKFIITAEKRLKEKDLNLEVFNFPIAIFSFFKSMADLESWEKQICRFNAKRLNHPNSDASRLHWGKIIQWPMSIWNIERAGVPIIFVGPVLSGPWVAIALEELKVLGLKYAIGIGAYGSFSEKLQINDIAIAAKAIVSDGTSKEYSNDVYTKPSQKLFELTKEIFQKEGQKFNEACVWTTDGFYRESVQKMKKWNEQGAECVNLETSTFYCVAKELEIESVYFGFILDLIHTKKWTGWGRLDEELKGNMTTGKSNLDLLEDLAVTIARNIKNGINSIPIG